VFAGAGLVVVGGLMLASSPVGVWLYLAILAVTWIWAFWEVGGDGWALVPRVVAPSVLGILALLYLLVLWRDVASDGRGRIVA
jgi:quinoprotein glucose dehydrogenase